MLAGRGHCMALLKDASEPPWWSMRGMPQGRYPMPCHHARRSYKVVPSLRNRSVGANNCKNVFFFFRGYHENYGVKLNQSPNQLPVHSTRKMTWTALRENPGSCLMVPKSYKGQDMSDLIQFGVLWSHQFLPVTHRNSCLLHLRRTWGSLGLTNSMGSWNNNFENH